MISNIHCFLGLILCVLTQTKYRMWGQFQIVQLYMRKVPSNTSFKKIIFIYVVWLLDNLHPYCSRHICFYKMLKYCPSAAISHYYDVFEQLSQHMSLYVLYLQKFARMTMVHSDGDLSLQLLGGLLLCFDPGHGDVLHRSQWGGLESFSQPPTLSPLWFKQTICLDREPPPQVLEHWNKLMTKWYKFWRPLNYKKGNLIFCSLYARKSHWHFNMFWDLL